jgi:glucokinase
MFIGIDIGGTTIKFGVVNKAGEILETERHDTIQNTKTSQQFLDLLISVCKKLNSKYPDIAGIGIGAPGQLSLDRHTLVQANNLSSLNGTNIVSPLKEAFPSWVVRLENDANCAALGEMYFGGHNLDNFIMIALGTGVGGGIIVHRKLFIGAKGNAGEVGFLVVGPERKVLEHYIGQRRLVAHVLQELNKPENASSTLQKEEEITVEKVFLAAKAGDKFALQIFDYVGMLIGETMVGLIHSFDIAQVIIGGGVGKSFELFEKSALKTAKSYLSDYYLQDLKLLPAGCSADTGLLGAAGLVINELETF